MEAMKYFQMLRISVITVTLNVTPAIPNIPVPVVLPKILCWTTSALNVTNLVKNVTEYYQPTV